MADRDTEVKAVLTDAERLALTTSVMDAYRAAGPMEPDPADVILRVWDVVEQIIYQRTAAATEAEKRGRADGWDESHAHWCDWLRQGQVCRFHANPYRADREAQQQLTKPKENS